MEFLKSLNESKEIPVQESKEDSLLDIEVGEEKVFDLNDGSKFDDKDVIYTKLHIIKTGDDKFKLFYSDDSGKEKANEVSNSSKENTIKWLRKETDALFEEGYMYTDDDYERIDRSGTDEERLIAAVSYMYGVDTDTAKSYIPDLGDTQRKKALAYYDLRDLPQAVRIAKIKDMYPRRTRESVDPSSLTDCPECGDTSFDSKRGRCTKCFYREELDESIEDFASITALADDCGKNTFKISNRDIRFTFENEDDKTKFVDELSAKNIPHNELTFGVISVNKSSALDESTQPLYIIKDKNGRQLSRPNPDDQELWDRVASMEARGKSGLSVVAYVEENKGPYIELSDPQAYVDELDFAGAVEIKGNKVYGDETTLRQLADAIHAEYGYDIKLNEFLDTDVKVDASEFLGKDNNVSVLGEAKDTTKFMDAAVEDVVSQFDDAFYHKEDGIINCSNEQTCKEIGRLLGVKPEDMVNSSVIHCIYLKDNDSKPVNEASYGGTHDIEDDMKKYLKLGVQALTGIGLKTPRYSYKGIDSVRATFPNVYVLGSANYNREWLDDENAREVLDKALSDCPYEYELSVLPDKSVYSNGLHHNLGTGIALDVYYDATTRDSRRASAQAAQYDKDMKDPIVGVTLIYFNRKGNKSYGFDTLKTDPQNIQSTIDEAFGLFNEYIQKRIRNIVRNNEDVDAGISLNLRPSIKAADESYIESFIEINRQKFIETKGSSESIKASEGLGYKWDANNKKFIKASDFDINRVINIEEIDETLQTSQEERNPHISDKRATLSEGNYGGAFDIADDQYFTRDDINNAAEKVLEHIQEIFYAPYHLGGTWFEDGKWIVNIQGEDFDEYEASVKVDMRKIKNPKDLERHYALDLVADIRKQIESINNDMNEDTAISSSHSFDDDDDLSFNYDDDSWEDPGVDPRKDFDHEGQEFTWVKKHGETIHMDFDNWAVWEAYCHNDAETYYFVVDEDTEFIDWGPCDSLKEAQDFLASKKSDYDDDDVQDDFYFEDFVDDKEEIEEAFDHKRDWYSYEDGWTDDDIALHKSIDWKARDYKEYPVEDDSFEADATLYTFNGKPQVKRTKFVKHLSPNGIFAPSYKAVEHPFPEHGLIGSYDGNKHNGIMVMDRFESQDVSDALSH